MNQYPKISVIIPVYNAEKYITSCINSILHQTFTNFEILLINDGSSDLSGKICDDFAIKDNRIRTFHKPNGGVSSARNLGLSQAKGEWICFIDADDALKDNFFSDANKIINKKMIDLYAYGCDILKNEKNTPLFSYQEKYYTVQDFWKTQYHHLASWGYLLSNKIIQKYQLKFDTNLIMSEDRIFIAEYLLYCKHIYSTEKNYYLYRITSESACGSKMTLTKANSQITASHSLINLNIKNQNNPLSKIIIPEIIYYCLKNYIASIAILNNKLINKEAQKKIKDIIKVLQRENISINKKLLFQLCSYNLSLYITFYKYKHWVKNITYYE